MVGAILAEFMAFMWLYIHLLPRLKQLRFHFPPNFDSTPDEGTAMAAEDITSHVATGNPIHDGSMLELARTVSTHRLTPQEIQEINQLAAQIHQRLETSRAIVHRSDEYARGSWLMTRTYIARALEESIANPPVQSIGSSSNPSGSDSLMMLILVSIDFLQTWRWLDISVFAM